MVDQPALCSSSEQLSDTHQGHVGEFWSSRRFPGLGAKQEGDAHVDHQGVPENPKWEVRLDPALGLVGSLWPTIPRAADNKGGLCWG